MIRHLRYTIFIIILCLFGQQLTQQSYADENSNALEIKVKAAVIFNFAKYIEWPEKTFATPDQPINVCMFGKNPYEEIFNSPQAPKEAQNRPFKVIELKSSTDAKEVAKCQIFYWMEDEEKKIESLTSTLKDHSVVTVSDKESDISLISFVIVDGKVRFKIRNDEAKERNLKISSQLLKLGIE